VNLDWARIVSVAWRARLTTRTIDILLVGFSSSRKDIPTTVLKKSRFTSDLTGLLYGYADVSYIKATLCNSTNVSMELFDDNIWAKIEEHLSERSKNKCATANLPAPFAKIIKVTREMHSDLIRAELEDITEQFRATGDMLTSAKNRLSTVTKTATSLEAMGFRFNPRDWVEFNGHGVEPRCVRINNEDIPTSSPKGMLYDTKSLIQCIGNNIKDLREKKRDLREEHMTISVMEARAASEAAMDNLDGDDV